MIVPPLDKIPKLPGKAAGIVQTQIDTQTDVLLEQVKKTIQNSVNLPVNTRCDDPKIKQIKDINLSKIFKLQANATKGKTKKIKGKLSIMCNS